MRQSAVGKDVNMEAEESTMLRAVTKQRLANTLIRLGARCSEVKSA
jgi:hypothetical protein